MATQVQLRRGTTAENDAFTGAQGELTFDTNNKRVRVHDGGTAGGFEIITENAAGKVGIGTTSPTGNVNANSLVLEVNSSGANPPEILAGGQNAEISIAGGSSASYLWSTGAYPLIMATNATERLRIDSSGNVGIGDGTLSPSSMLHIYKSGATADLALQSAGASGRKHILQSKTDGALAFYDNNAATERMRIDSSGNLQLGKTASGIGTNGITLYGDGAIGAADFTRDGGRTLALNRKTSDGDILEFRKDGSTVGSIRSIAGPQIAIGGTTDGLAFYSGGNQIYPCNMSTGGDRDATIDLGYASSRWKDFYLSGGVYLGGTGSANYLDDYEFGTWTVNVYKGGGALAVTARNAGYVRVGNVVHYWFNWRSTTATTTGTSSWEVQGFPFAVVAGTSQGNFINGGYVIINGTGYGDQSPYRWQANSSTALTLYGTQGTTNTSSGSTQFSGAGSLEIL